MMEKIISMGLSRQSIALLLIGLLAGASVPTFFLLQTLPTSQQPTQASKPAPALEKFKVSADALLGTSRGEGAFLVVDAANDRRVWATYGLDPEFVSPQDGRVRAAEVKAHVASGIKIGMIPISEILLARSAGVPVKIVAGYTGVPLNFNLYVRGDGPIKTVKDLDGKKVGVSTGADVATRHTSYLSKKYGISIETVPLGNVTGQVVGLKLGKVDAFWGSSGAPLRLVDSGELRVLLSGSDYVPKEMATRLIWATEDIIEQNPDMVRRFVKAWLETAKYLKENPSYAVELHMKNTNAPRDLAEKAVASVDWTPGGRGSGQDLLVSVKNWYQFAKDSGIFPPNIDVKIEDAVDVRFVP